MPHFLPFSGAFPRWMPSCPRCVRSEAKPRCRQNITSFISKNAASKRLLIALLFLRKSLAARLGSRGINWPTITFLIPAVNKKLTNEIRPLEMLYIESWPMSFSPTWIYIISHFGSGFSKQAAQLLSTPLYNKRLMWTCHCPNAGCVRPISR